MTEPAAPSESRSTREARGSDGQEVAPLALSASPEPRCGHWLMHRMVEHSQHLRIRDDGFENVWVTCFDPPASSRHSDERALLIEQIAVRLHLAALREESAMARREGQDRIEFAIRSRAYTYSAEIVRSFATPGDDR